LKKIKSKPPVRAVFFKSKRGRKRERVEKNEKFI